MSTRGRERGRRRPVNGRRSWVRGTPPQQALSAAHSMHSDSGAANTDRAKTGPTFGTFVPGARDNTPAMLPQQNR